MTINPRPFGLAAALLGTTLILGACGRTDNAGSAPTTTSGTSSTPAAATVAPPTGDSTPKAADSVRSAVESNEKTGSSGPQTTVNSAAAGAPPYTLNSAPEGNKDSNAGQKASDEPKK